LALASDTPLGAIAISFSPAPSTSFSFENLNGNPTPIVLAPPEDQSNILVTPEPATLAADAPSLLLALAAVIRRRQK
jgi:hypothetical protein